MNTHQHLPDSDPAHFLRIAGQGASLASHADLWRWLQGDVQHLLAHDVMLIGWGDFRSGNLNFDIVSSLPGVRTQNCTPAMVAPLLGYLRDCWVAALRTPLVLDMANCSDLAERRGSVVSGMRSAVVHGIGDGKRTGERIFAAFGTQMPPAGNATGALRLLTPYIDTALRQMAPAPQRHAACSNDTVSRQVVKLLQLSERERQIMTWVAMGKTNPEIGCILSISEFTVKNHMKSIFGKLDVTNRAQAVAKLTRVDAYA
ncbi:MAG: XrtB/PEP-CTERM-associated transcriptional regulator EpsA [Pseudomonadota bacterium]